MTVSASTGRKTPETYKTYTTPDRKRADTLRARFALMGLQVFDAADGEVLVVWGTARRLQLDEAEQLIERLGRK